MSRPVYDAGREAVRSLRSGNVVNAGKCVMYVKREQKRAILDQEFNSMDVVLDFREGIIDGLLEG